MNVTTGKVQPSKLSDQGGNSASSGSGSSRMNSLRFLSTVVDDHLGFGDRVSFLSLSFFFFVYLFPFFLFFLFILDSLSFFQENSIIAACLFAGVDDTLFLFFFSLFESPIILMPKGSFLKSVQSLFILHARTKNVRTKKSPTMPRRECIIARNAIVTPMIAIFGCVSFFFFFLFFF